MSLINRCYNCKKNDIVCENLHIMNIKLEYYEFCEVCIKQLKNILTIILDIPNDIITIILSFFGCGNTDILNKNYNFISLLKNKENLYNSDSIFQLKLVLGYGKPRNSKELPNEIKSFYFVNKLLQKYDMVSLYTVSQLLYNKNKHYRKLRKELINKNKLEYIFINISSSFSNIKMIHLVYKPNKKTTTFNVIDYENKNIIKTMNAANIINNNYVINVEN